MKKTALILLLLVLLLAVAIALGFLAVRRSKPAFRAMSGSFPGVAASGVPANATANFPRTHTATPMPAAAPAPLPLDTEGAKAIQECTENEARTAEEVIQQVAGNSPRVVEWENAHLRRPDGTIVRLRLSLETNAEGKEWRKLQVFTEDAEGLPVPSPLPAELERNPSPEVLTRLAGQGVPFFNQIAWSVKDLQVIEEKGQVVALELSRQLAGHAATLLCETENDRTALSCRCIRQAR